MNDINIKAELKDLIREAGGAGGCVALESGDSNAFVASVEYSSHNVVDGSIFVAVEGFAKDGHQFVRDAVRKGARTIVISTDKKASFADLKDINIIASDDTRRALSILSAAFYKFPSRNIPVIGVTGTNGKTSITYMIEAILKKHGMNPGVLGTVNYRWNNKSVVAKNTTPESKDIHELFARMVADGVNVIIMEVSSHALKLGRVIDIEFNAGIFTNLTRDHLDFHKTFEDYFESKKILFELINKNKKKDKVAIVNTDDDYGKKIADNWNYEYKLSSIGISGGDYRIDASLMKNLIDGVSYELKNPAEAKGVRISLNVSGKFQIYNSLCALAVCHRMGVPLSIIKDGLADLSAIPGRFERIGSHKGFSVVVDYAHTNDALEKLLASVNELPHNRIITVVGCGGDRDKTKRPLMGKAAVHNSDLAIITSDNPRSENPNDIIKDIVSGLDKNNYEVEPDRETAIRHAIGMARKDDIIVLAGKGHEDYQIIGNKTIHFDDREIAKKYIEALQ